MQVLHCPFEGVYIVDKEKVYSCLVLEDKNFHKKDSGNYSSEDGNDKGKVSLNSCHNLVGKDELFD